MPQGCAYTSVWTLFSETLETAVTGKAKGPSHVMWQANLTLLESFISTYDVPMICHYSVEHHL